MTDWLDGDDAESGSVATDGLGFDEDLDDFDDDGMDDLDGFDDDGMGDFDDDGTGDFGDDGMGEGLGGPDVDADTIAEMEDRISELENQISSTTSEMNTVREENKQIGETVEELDETIRKLLDIYEMVTRGINPFVDDAREMGGLENEGAFGLFEMEDESEEELDPEVAEADAETFFDEDFGDIDAETDEAELAAGDELADAEREDPAAALDVDADGDDAGDDGDDGDASGGGASFDELKSEYEESGGFEDLESGDADEDERDTRNETREVRRQADDHTDAEAADDFDEDVGAADEDPGDVDAAAEADEGDAAGAAADAAAGDAVTDAADAAPVGEDGFVDSDPVDPAPATAPSEERSNGTASGAAVTTHTASAADSTAGDADDAYLAAIPARYTAESVVLEWAQFLVEVGGVVGATRALRQYREQGWITRRVERTVAEHVRNAAVAGETEETRDLRVRDHRESLTYVSRLAGDVDEARLIDELSALGGGARGIRR